MATVNKYKNYTVNDFISDDFFIQSVKKPSEQSVLFWESFVKEFPYKEEDVEAARKIVESIGFRKRILNEKEVVRLKEEISLNFQEVEEGRGISKLVKHWRRIAAVIVGVGLISLISFYFYFIKNRVIINNPYGVVKTINLPDSSVVILNGNSRLEYQLSWNKNEDRVVKLIGEAFFSVKHTVNHQKFIVKTSDAIDVEVLGTSFNISRRLAGIKIYLESGKVKVNISRAGLKDSVLMKPGELIQFANQELLYTKIPVSSQRYTAWTKKKISFEETPLAEVVSILEESYGLKVEVVNSELLSKKISGTAPLTDINLFLEALSGSVGLKIERKGDVIYIE